MRKYSKEEKDSSKPFEEIRLWNFEIMKSVPEFMKLEMAEFSNEIFVFWITVFLSSNSQHVQ